MNLKQKIVVAGFAAIIASVGIFGANIVQAQTDNSQIDPVIAQMQQMIESLKQQIQQIIALIFRLKPLETCGNGICRFGETAVNCAEDCAKQTDIVGNQADPANNNNCAKEDAACAISKCDAPDSVFETKCVGGASGCCAGLVCVLGDNGLIGTCKKDAIVCATEGEIIDWRLPATKKCCSGLTSILDCNVEFCSKSSNSICTKCGNGQCGLGENRHNCPADCALADACDDGTACGEWTADGKAFCDCKTIPGTDAAGNPTQSASRHLWGISFFNAAGGFVKDCSACSDGTKCDASASDSKTCTCFNNKGNGLYSVCFFDQVMGAL